jgi:drug/metabolite transporter (DMT)-like permease
MIVSSSVATLTTIVAEIALALHPIIIKEIPASLTTQLLARLGTYGTLSLALASPSERQETWGSLSSATQSMGLGLINIVHIASSYISYALLPAGSALALFYTYPFMNILMGILFLGDSFNWYILPLMALAFIGVLLIAKSTKESDVEKPEASDKYPKLFHGVGWGIVMSLISAFTETIIFLVTKAPKGERSPWLSMSKFYPGALIALLAWIFITKQPITTDWSIWKPLLAFNILIGFVGYSLRFFSIPFLPTAVFSILTFIGVAAGYMWGVLFSKEIPNMQSLTGAGLITGSLALMKFIS